MIKIRLQGTKFDLKQIITVLERNKSLKLENQSEFIPNKGTKKYYRYYAEIFWKEDQDERG